jgi:hypothetical protein
MCSRPDPPSGDPSSHLDSHTIAALVELHLDEAQRTEVERHLAGCALCRSELYVLRRLVRSLPTRRSVRLRRVILGAGMGAAAAALGFLVLRDTGADRTPPSRSVLERSAPAAAERVLLVREPRGDATVSRTRLRFVWENAGPGSRYQLTVVDSIGGQLWRTETTDTFVVVPVTLSLPRNALVFWYVDALGPDARLRTTRATALRLEP